MHGNSGDIMIFPGWRLPQLLPSRTATVIAPPDLEIVNPGPIASSGLHFGKSGFLPAASLDLGHMSVSMVVSKQPVPNFAQPGSAVETLVNTAPAQPLSKLIPTHWMTFSACSHSHMTTLGHSITLSHSSQLS